MLRKILLLSLVCFLGIFVSCSDDDNNGSEKVPEAVMKSFKKDYPNVIGEQWSQKGKYYVAKFATAKAREINNLQTSVWYNESGKEEMNDMEIPFSQLPFAVLESFKNVYNSMYAGWEIDDDANVVDRAEMGLVYIVEIENAVTEEERELSFTAEGVLVKDVLDDDDDDDILPVDIPVEIAEVLNTLFKGQAQVVEYEVDEEDNEIEVDILDLSDNRRHKEVYFDLQYNWVGTEYDVTFEEAKGILSAEALQNLTAQAAEAGLDLTNKEFIDSLEISYVHHATKGYFLEIEVEFNGNELDVLVDMDGNFQILPDED